MGPTATTPEMENVEDLVASMMEGKLNLQDMPQPPDLEETSPLDLLSEAAVGGGTAQQKQLPPNAAPGRGREGTLRGSYRAKMAPHQAHNRLSSMTALSQTRMSPFGALLSAGMSGATAEQGTGRASSFSRSLISQTAKALSAHGEVRREVLTTIFLKGMKSSNVIARGAAPAAQRAVQAMDRQRAVDLLNMPSGGALSSIGKGESAFAKDLNNGDTGAETEGNDGDSELSNDSAFGDPEAGRVRGVGGGPPSSGGDLMFPLSASGGNLSSMDQGSGGGGNAAPPTEEDEAMEALRLLIIQSRLAQGKPNERGKGAKDGIDGGGGDGKMRDLSGMDDGRQMRDDDPRWEDEDHEIVDAGDVDPRLAGCGTLPRTILNALKLWQAGTISNVELLDLVQKDLQYLRHSALLPSGAEDESKLKEDSAFWGRFAFGERWAEKKARIQTSSQHGGKPGWDLVGVIVKSNDDLRQEAFVMQLIELCQEAFEMAGLELWVQPYRILATGQTTGIIEMVRNAMSFDALKKRPGYEKGGLRGHFQRMSEFAADPAEAFELAQKNFIRSLAAYSLLSYLFMFKDRHNGNILLDTAGHVIHIDFGFVFGIAPGGSFSLEQSVPFKLTEEMIDVMGGRGSPLFTEFVTLFCCGFLSLQTHMKAFLTIVEVTCQGSAFNCFQGRDPSEVVDKLRTRFCPNLDREGTVAFALDLIKYATTSYGTKQYDYFQYLSQGIAS